MPCLMLEAYLAGAKVSFSLDMLDFLRVTPFQAKVLRPIIDGDPSPSLSDICEKHGISSRVKASNMIITVKRRFQKILRFHIRQFVDSDAAVDEEIRHLMRILSKRVATL